MLDDEVYRTLGVARDADAATVKAAYRKIALETHPDRPGHDEAARARFESASRAYAAWLAEHDPAAPGAAAAPTAAGFTNVEDIFSSFSELFGDFFGGKFAQGGGSKDLRIDLKLTEADASCGVSRELEVTRGRPCTACKLTPCAACKGKGQVQRAQGFFMIQEACGACRGRGERVETTCGKCTDGLVKFVETINVAVPPGVVTGQSLRIPEKGNEGADGTAGNLYVVIEVTAAALSRKGDDVESEIVIDARRYLIGGTLKVESVAGEADVRVPLWPRDGTVITLRERGYPRVAEKDAYRGEMTRGDHRVILRVSPEVRSEARKLVAMTLAVIAIIVAFAL